MCSVLTALFPLTHGILAHFGPDWHAAACTEKLNLSVFGKEGARQHVAVAELHKGLGKVWFVLVPAANFKARVVSQSARFSAGLEKLDEAGRISKGTSVVTW